MYCIERHRVPKVVAQRKRWAKFGDVEGEGEGPNRANTQIADEVFLTLTTNREVRTEREHFNKIIEALVKLVQFIKCDC